MQNSTLMIILFLKLTKKKNSSKEQVEQRDIPEECVKNIESLKWCYVIDNNDNNNENDDLKDSNDMTMTIVMTLTIIRITFHHFENNKTDCKRLIVNLITRYIVDLKSDFQAEFTKFHCDPKDQILWILQIIILPQIYHLQTIQLKKLKVYGNDLQSIEFEEAQDQRHYDYCTTASTTVATTKQQQQ
ncbi:hypothetical protein Glove_15g43 [Diversispora epigaea]|uniref:Uncharacterized protein n=1 Tax=Diversispora epigaea TaxID=1348612 RepID=A0A397JX23_9GLOM|nr:hypothetical protein Glove_15g43 [Diversispora epigaea]